MALLYSALLGAATILPQFVLAQGSVDPCADIAGKQYVTPASVRACYNNFQFNTTLRDNILEVVSKTMNFHTSVNYQIQAPSPFNDTRVDLVSEFERIKKATYKTDFEFHQDLSRQLKRLNDGHGAYLNYCYDSAFVTYLPFPLVLLNDEKLSNLQNVHIAPEAFDVASKEFAPYIDEWQKVSKLDFKKYAGARVLAINGQNPWDAADASAALAGGYQGFPTRENSFFSSTIRSAKEYTYRMGDFASQSLPLKDSVTLTVQTFGSGVNKTITIPYISRFGSASKNFTNSADYWTGNCVATAETNGKDAYQPTQSFLPGQITRPRRFGLPEGTDPKQQLSYFIDEGALYDVSLPGKLSPTTNSTVNGGQAFFYILPESNTGVLALGSFSGMDYEPFFQVLKDGIQDLVNKNVTHFIVDITNNGGGYICVAHFLHRLLSGPDKATDLQAGLDTQTRSSPFIQSIVQAIIDKGPDFDPQNLTMYKPTNFKAADSETGFNATYNWLVPDVPYTINGQKDAFSQKLGEECHPFPVEPLAFQPFPLGNVAILGNGRCASSCALFTINMKIKHAVKTVVMGGRAETIQQYCGTVGGQSTSYTAIDTELKTVGLKNHTEAPPDFITDSYQGITWRLGFGIYHPESPEEWADHPAQFNFPLTAATVNNPQATWKYVASRLWDI